MPLALAAPELVLILGLAVALVLLLVVVQLYSNARQARGFAVDLPVIANPTVAAIDFINHGLVAQARFIDSIVTGLLYNSVQGLGRIVVLAFNLAGAAILTLIHHTAARAEQAYNLAVHIQSVEITRLGAQVVALEAELATLRRVENAALAAAVSALELELHREIAPVVASVAAVAARLAPYEAMLARLASLPQDAAATIARLSALTAAQSATLGILAAQVATLESGASALERQVAAQQVTVARLALLLTIAGAGALAIENLLRLARDPCYCLNSGGFSDLPGRVEALENFGP